MSIHPFLVNIMVKMFPKKEEKDSDIQEVEPLAKQENEGNEAALVLQKLKSEEACLMEEKQNLSSLKESLQNKAKQEIELRKSNIQKLKFDITDLKVSCEALTKSLNTGLMSQ